ncbi:MAG: YncE family protein [Chloroflexota bacterium]
MTVFLNVLLIAFAVMTIDARAEESLPLQVAQTIALPDVEGRIDHMAVDVKGQRLFVAALGNDSLEVLDLRAGKHLQSITGFHEPQGVGFVPGFNKLFVANGKNGACDILDGSSFKRTKSLKLDDDADNVRYDALAHRIYVGHGSGGLAAIDPADGNQIGDIKLEAHPESFQLEKSGPRIFVNLPSAQKIAVVNRETRTIIASWPTAGAAANFPMALDESHHRLFVGFRKPAKLLVFNTNSGKMVAKLESPGDADDIFYDSSRRRIYVSGGEGSIGVFQQKDADHYQPMAKIPTTVGARTALFAPELNRLYLAVPHRGSQRAEVRVYKIE